MLLRNYDNIIAYHSLAGSYSVTEKNYGEGYLTCKQPNGSIYYINHSVASPFSSFLEKDVSPLTSPYPYGSNLIAGGGGTPVTYDDYNLDVPFTTSQVIVVGGTLKTTPPEYDSVKKQWISTVSRVFMAKEDITVKEIGITYNTVANTGWALVYRKVLDYPINVPANANFVLSFTMTVSANPNKPANYNASAEVV